MAFTYGEIKYCKSANGTADNIYQVRLGYQLNSQDTTNNKSNITLRLEARSTSSSYTTYGYNQTPTIDGTTLSARSFDFRSTNTWQNFGERTFDVNHNADGTYSVSKTGSFTTSLTGGRVKSGSASVTVTLPTIPRASTFTISKTSGGSEATSFTLGETIYANITRASTSFTHKVYWKVGSSSNQSLSNSATTSASGTLALNMASYIPGTSATATIYVDTYNGTTLVGSASKTFTLNVPSSVVPTISSVSKSDTAGYLSTYNAYVQGKSTLRVQTTASGVYGSSIDSSAYVVKLKSGNTVLITKSGPDVSFANISYTGSITVEVTVTDSRGRTATNSSSITVAEYASPTITSFIAERRSQNATVTISYNATIKNINNNNANSKTFRVYKRQKGTSSWGNAIATYTSGYTYSGSFTTSCDENYGWEFLIQAQDSFSTTSVQTDVGTVFELINYGSNGTSIAFGKVAEKSNSFECELDTYFKNLGLYDSTNGQYVTLEVEVVDTW